MTPPPSNTPPVLDPVADQASDIDVYIELQVAATDDDGDTLSYTATALPTGLSIDSATGLISGSPSLQQIVAPRITVSDGQAADTKVIKWTVGTPPPRLVSGTLSWNKQVIDTSVGETHIAVGADFDGDGDTDVAATDFVNDSVVWYENDGAGGFIRRVLDSNLNGAYPAQVADIDDDGDIDLFAAGYEADTVIWYENNGAASFTRRVIDQAANGAHSIVPADLDSDGDTDLVASNQDADTVTWYENDGAQSFVRHTIDASAAGAKRADVADFDGDGDLDVVAISFASDQLAWHENDGSNGFTKRVIDSSLDGGYFVSPGDLDGDGDVDLLTASQLDDTIAWFENNGAGTFVKRTIDTSAHAPRSVIAADVDGDGDIDAIAASVDDDTVRWYENDGAGGFAVRVIDFGANGAYGVFALDFERDGDSDVLVASRDDNTVALHRQSRSHQVTVDLGGTFVIDSNVLSAVDSESGSDALEFKIINPPAFGVLQLGATALPAGGTFTQSDVDQGLLSYAHDGASTTADLFTFELTDGEPGRRPIAGAFNVVVNDPAALLVDLPLDEGVGSVASDHSGFGHDGTLVGGATFEADTADGSPSAVLLDGIDGAIELPAIDVEGDGLTLALWFKPDSLSTHDARLISKASGTSASEHVFMLSTMRSGSEIRLRARIRTNGVTTTLIASGGSITTGAWRHAAVTYDGSVARLYLDGVEVGSVALSGLVDTDPTLPVAVGAQPPGAGGRHFDGLVDDVRILDGALSAGELAAIASSNP